MSIDEIAVPTTRKVSVSFEHKLAPHGSYSNSTAKVWIEGLIPANASEVEINAEVASLLNVATASVFVQLGVEFAVDPDTMVVYAVPQPLPPSPAAQQIEQAFAGGGAPAPAAPQGGLVVKNPGWNGPELPAWLINEAAKFGVTAIYDNRQTATGSQPLFREAVPRGGTGKGKDGAPKAFFAP